VRVLLRRGWPWIAVACVAVYVGAYLRDSSGATVSSAEARLIWTGNYESGNFEQWHRVLREDAGAARVVTKPKPVFEGRYAARFILGPQTAVEGTRIEAHQPDVTTSGGTYGSETSYRWAEYVPRSSAFGRDKSFNHLVQWHPALGCFGAALSVNGLTRPERLLFNVRGGDILRFGGSCELRHERWFDLGPLPRDRWLHFRLHIKWHADPDVGFVELWVNGRRKIARTYVATSPPGVGHYVRQGIYRVRCTCRTIVYGDAMTVEQVVP
jgi:Polysaccharide lyase